MTSPEQYSIVWGPPGVGKTTMAIRARPAAFLKDCDTKWWDKHAGQDELILGDSGVTARQWLGEVTVPVEVQGGATQMGYTSIITSPMCIQKIVVRQPSKSAGMQSDTRSSMCTSMIDVAYLQQLQR